MLSRRQFLHSAAAGTAALSAAHYARAYEAGSKLRVAAIGVGGKGWSDLTSVAASPHVDVIALCDIDETANHLGRAAMKFPKAKKFTDWRKVMDEAKSFDAVIVSTPDHMHVPISLPAMQMGKHVYCQKPLAHSVFEARQMSLAAKKNKVVTQMGNQIQSHEYYRTAVKLVHDGMIGKVREVHSWQSGSMYWILVDDRPKGKDPIPKGVHWDNWLGVAAERPYKDKIYHPFNWRAWQAFSTGQLGDFGCHIMDPVFMAVGLTSPMSVRAEAPPINKEIWAKKSKVSYRFPGTKYTASRSINLTWYDGLGHKPSTETLGLGRMKLPGSGSVLIGEKGTLLIPHVGKPQVFVEGKPATAKIEVVPSVDHYTGWADACRGVGKATSSFDYSGPLTETVMLGTIAIRLPETSLTWDAKSLRFTNSAAANGMVKKSYRKGWEPAWVA